MAMHQDSISSPTYKDLIEWPGYGIDDAGDVWSVRKGGGGRMTVRKKLNPWVKDSGHLVVSLRRDGRTIKRMVHQLVLETFVGPCPDGMEARHRDGNPKNNDLGNLEWNTRSINTIDRQYHKPPTGRRRLTAEQVREIRRRCQVGASRADLAAEFHTTQTTISHVANGKTWKRELG